MSGLAVAVDFDRPDPGLEPVRRMLAAMPHRSPDGTSVAAAPHAVLGMALRATTARERAAAQPLHDPAAGLWVVADARIDNRDDLAAALGVKVPASDVELILLGYERWGERLADRLYGDFAFVVWNERDRMLYAARDAFGMRPLFWHEGPGRLLIASEVDALLATGEFGWEVEDETVADFLALNRYRDLGRTFFRQVRRLRPGHVATFSVAGMEERRWFVYPDLSCHTGGEAEDAAEFRHRFRRAVADRLEADRPMVSELSGGLDSGSIGCTADAIYREHPADRPPLTLASALYPGFACDERAYIEAVHRRVLLPFATWDGTTAQQVSFDAWPLAVPYREDPSDPSWRARKLAGDAGGRAILTGAGGDTLMYEQGVFRDLAAHGRFVKLARETFRFRRPGGAPWHERLVPALRAAVPAPARRVFRLLRPALAERPPPWLGPRLRAGWRPAVPPAYPEAAPSWTQKMTWAWLTLPTPAWYLEVNELLAARDGLQLRCPFFDRRLAEWVLAVPWERRLPSGRMKRLLRRAMAGLLPPEVVEREDFTVFDDLVAWTARRSRPLLSSFIAGPRWESAPYVDRSAAGTLLETAMVLGRTEDWWPAAELRHVAMLECWLRTVGSGRR